MNQPKNQTVELTLLVGPEGRAIYLNNRCIAGRKPAGGGFVIQTWHVRAEDIREALEPPQQ
jgi:hypothetical protein